VGVALALVFLTVLGGAGAIRAGLPPARTTTEFMNQGGTVEAVGVALYDPSRPWLFPFEVTSFLLLVGAVGAIVLAKRRI
jgi:NADH:ubiquinone oxidoreductase subunit 6 (subunit J)